MDIFDAAAAGNLAMIAKKVSGGQMDDDEELDPGTVQRLSSFAFDSWSRTPARRARRRGGGVRVAPAQTTPTSTKKKLQKREAKDLALKKERDALWKRNDLRDGLACGGAAGPRARVQMAARKAVLR